jgi:beta-lactam-binding protein with PASTA domain
VCITAALGAGCGDDVPDVTGKTQAEAESMLAEAELELGTVQIGDGDGDPGTVVDQDPAAGEDIPEDKKVSLVLKGEAGAEPDAGTVTVPPLTSLTVNDAITLLAEAGLVLGEQRAELHDGPAGVIFDQNPFAGAGVAPGTIVDVTVASDAIVAVPAIVGKPQRDAEQMLTDAGLVVDAIEQRVVSGRTSVPVGGVIESNPGPGIRVARETPVRLIVRQESTTVPNVDGLKAQQAQLKVFGSNLRPVVRYIYDKKRVGLVISQAPADGAVVAKHSAVQLRIGTTNQRQLNTWYQYMANGSSKAMSKSQVEAATRTTRQRGGGIK